MSTSRPLKRVPKSAAKKDPLLNKRFRSVVADANVLWQVKSKSGRAAYICEAVNETTTLSDGRVIDSDFAGEHRAFLRSQIEHALRAAAAWEKSTKAHVDFYDSLELGQIVHYDNGFGDFVRCEVVTLLDFRQDMDHFCLRGQEGQKCLKEIALVGNWKDHDLRPNNYHVSGIQEGRRFKPNASCIWENHESPTHKRYDDPSKLPALTPQEGAPAQLKPAMDLKAIVNSVELHLGEAQDYRNARVSLEVVEVEALLQAAKAYLNTQE